MVEASALAGPDTFDRMFEASDDPWGFRTRWYEERKRDLTLASLPDRRYGFAYEPGCANGELSAALAPRCDRLLVSDIAPAAVALAQQRLAAWPHASAVRAVVPADWPDEPLALLVLSELAYYLSDAELDLFVDKSRASLGEGGTFVACHWRHPIPDARRDGDAVHRILDAGLKMTRLVHHLEQDFVLEVWSNDGRSVARREAKA